MDFYQIILIILGILHNLILIIIFILRKWEKWKIVFKLGILYDFLSIPSIYLLIIAILEHYPQKDIIFLSIFILFIGFEMLLDHILKIEFRSNWKILVPYLILYYASNYSIVMLNWNQNLFVGILILVLMVLQIIINIITHPKIEKKSIL